MTTRLVRRRTVVAGMWAGVAIVLAGCGGGSPESARGDETTTTTVPWADQIAPPPDARHDPLVVFDRIDELVYGSTASLLHQRDRAAIECMAERGFDVAVGPPPTPATPAQLGVPEPTPITRRDFATRWGFGLAASWGADGRVDPRVHSLATTREYTTHDMSDEDGIPVVQLDLEQVAKANEDFTAVNDALVVDGDQPSCQHVANSELKLLTEGPFYAGDELRQQVSERIDADAEMIALIEAYRACMERSGFAGVSSPTEAFSLNQRALLSIGDRVQPGGNSPSSDQASPEIKDEFHELQNRERAMALANLECEPAYTPAVQHRTDEIQREVLRDNQPLVGLIKES